jgi:choline-glycine betaine transporter
MKYVKPRKDLMLIFAPLLIIIGILLFSFFPHEVSHFFYAFWLCIPLSVFLIFTKLGNKKLENESEPHKPLHFLRWFFSILFLEIALTALYLGITEIVGNLLPINTSTHNTLFLSSLHQFLFHFGLFPWGIYALIAVGMGVLAYQKSIHAFFSEFIKSISHQKAEKSLSLIINVSMRRVVLFGVSTTFMLMTLLLISLFLPINKLVVYGFYPAALLATLFLLLASLSNQAKRIIERIFSNRVPSALMYPVFIIALAFAVLILSAITSQLTKKIAPSIPPTLIQNWIHYNWHTAWIIFSVMWWCSLTPVIAAWIARLSKGYSIRTILIGILILPTIITILLMINPGLISLTLSPLIIKIIALLSFFIVFPMLINHGNSSYAILSYFPQSGITKYRDEHFFFQRIAQLTTVALYFYLVIGINGLSLFIFAPNCFTILILLVSSIAITLRSPLKIHQKLTRESERN